MSLVAAFRTVSVHAAEPPDTGQGVVVFAIDPRTKDAQAMVDAVRAHLTGLPVRLASEAPGSDLPPPANLLGTLTIDPTAAGEWVVSFTEPAIDTTLVRHIRLKPQGRVVALEEAAIVVRSMIEAILDGGHVGIARLAPGAQGALSRSSQRGGVAVTAGYTGGMFAQQLGWQSGALVGLRWQMGEIYAGGTYGGFLPALVESELATISLLRHPAALVFGYEGTSRVALIGEIELTADYIQRFQGQLRADLSPTPDEPRWSFLAGAEVGVAWTFVPRFRAMGRVGIDWMINRYTYFVAGPSGGDVVTPSALRPKFDLVVGIDIW